jgi:hypothetical protein
MVQNEGKPVIDFTSYIAERTFNFTGREWVFQAINEWLADPAGARFFLLKGEPGSGKTAISARLSQFAEGTVSPPDGLVYLHPDFLSALHFCSARDSRWISPRVFTESLALQLANSYPVYAKALAEKSGDRSIHIEVQQHIEQGQGVGVFISKLDVSGATPEDAFNRIVREPFEALVVEELNRQVILLVDALDEALSSTITPSIVDLLSHTDNMPPHVRFILTTRQESRVENKFHNVNELSLSIPLDQRNQVDIGRYVQGRLRNDLELEKIAEQIEPEQMTQLVEIIPRKAEGNFLYARFLLDAMAKGLRSLNEWDGLPTGLDALYFDSLNRVVELGKRDWFTEYRPLMGVLSVAQESLTLAQIQSFTYQSESSCLEYRRNLEQFIEEVKPQEEKGEQETKYRLYHQSVMDFLHSKIISFKEKRGERELENPFYLPADEYHKHMAKMCEQDNLSIIWEDTKRNPVEQGRREYARQYYIVHLYQGQEWQRLFSALDAGTYGQSKMHYDPSTHAYAQDLDLGRQATIWEGWKIDEGIALLPRLWQYTLLRCSLTSRVDRYPEKAFQLLVILGRKQEALGLAELLTNPIKKTQVLVYIALQLREQAGQDSEWLELLKRACEVSHTINDSSWHSSAQAEALSALGTALAQAQQLEQASQAWAEAERLIYSIEDRSAQAEALSALGIALAQAQQWTEAERVIRAIKGRSAQAEALSALGTALAQAQQLEQASQAWTEAERLIRAIGDSFWEQMSQAEALSALGTALIQAQQWTEAERVIRAIKVSSAQAEMYRDQAKMMELRDLAKMMAQTDKLEQLLHLIQQAWQQAKTREEALALFSIANTVISHKPYYGIAFFNAFTWVDTFFGGGN